MRSEVQVLLDPPSPYPGARFGALAQLVERLLCKQDVIGSNPLGSTIIRHDQKEMRFFLVLSDARAAWLRIYIVQRDNRRYWPYPSVGAVPVRSFGIGKQQ